MNPAGWGAVAVGAGLALTAVLVLAPGYARIPKARRRPTGPDEGRLADAAETATMLVGRAMQQRQGSLAARLDLAGVRARPQDFVFLVLVASVVLAAVGLLLGGPVLLVLFALLGPLLAVLWLRVRTSRRRKRFADQLDDTLQLLASGLRAGHSLMQALAGVAREADEPTGPELGRIINETRVGRPLAVALDEAAARMRSDDFRWVAEAIAINREVGGNLADVLDGVGKTIRERNQIRRHVAALSAEGRLSAVILTGLPFVVAGFLLLINPGYLAPFVHTVIGVIALVVSAILLTIGIIWMAAVVKVRF